MDTRFCVSDPTASVRVMEVVWAGVGFLIGLALWIPFVIDARIDTKLIKLEGRIDAQLIRAGWRDRRT